MEKKPRANFVVDQFLRDARNERMKAAQRRNKLWKSGVSKWRAVAIFLGLTFGWLLGLWINDFKVAFLTGGIIVGTIIGTFTDYHLRK
jgi:F0F1-type ATP synthase assembly protein I